LELRRDDLLNPRSYAVQLAGRDVAVEPADFDEALYTLGTAPREQYESVWPSLDVMIAQVLYAGRNRRIAESKSRSLTDGRRPGETEMEQWKREADTEGPDATMRAAMDAYKAKYETPVEKKPTQPPPASTTPRKGTLREMRPSYVDSVMTILTELEKMASDETCDDYNIAMGLLRTVSERNTVATAMGVLRVYWPADVLAERKAADAEASKPQ